MGSGLRAGALGLCARAGLFAIFCAAACDDFRALKGAASLRTCEKSYRRQKCCMYMRYATYRRLDPSQNTIPITHPPLPIIDLRQTRINTLSLSPSSTRNRRNAPRSSRSHLCRSSRTRRIRSQRLDIFRFLRSALEPRNQIQSLNKCQILHLSSCTTFSCELRVQCEC